MSRAKNIRASKQRASRSEMSKHMLQGFIQTWHERAEQERSAWLRRPRVHTAIFEEAWFYDELEKIFASFRQKLDPIFAREKENQRETIAARTRELGWSTERIESFTQCVLAYRRELTIQNYLRLRREFPEVEIQVGQFSGIEVLFTLEKDFKNQGINPQLIAAALDADEPGIDALCLRLLELLAARDNLPKSGPGHLERRRNAISDATVNYLIAMILEAYDWHEHTPRVPASLVVLIRHQLCGSLPDLETEARLREHRKNVALSVAQRLKPGEKLSINKLKKLSGLPRTTAARWLADPEFQSWLKLGEEWTAEGLFEEGRRAAIQRIMS